MAPPPAQAAAILGLSPEVFALQTTIHEGEIFYNISLVFYGIMLWELIMFTPTELRVVYIPEVKRMMRGSLPSLPSVFLFISRILIIPFVCLGIVFFQQPNYCQPINRAWSLMIAISTFLCLGIFILRCAAIRGAGWPLQVWLWANAFAVSGLWIAWACSLTVDTLPMPLPTNVYGGTCYNIGNIPSWTYGIYIYTALFDFMILCLTLHATIPSQSITPSVIKSRISTLSNVSKRFLSDSIIYFGFSFAVHTVEFAWVFTHKENGLYSGIILPIHAFVMLIIGARTVTNLKTVAAGKNYLLPSMAVNSSGGNKYATGQHQRGGFGGNGGLAGPQRSAANALQGGGIYSTQEMSISVDPPFAGSTMGHHPYNSAPYEMNSFSPAGTGEKGTPSLDDPAVVQFAPVQMHSGNARLPLNSAGSAHSHRNLSPNTME